MGNYFLSIHSHVLSFINSLVNGHQISYACLYLLSLLRIQNFLCFLPLRKGPCQFIRNTLSLDFFSWAFIQLTYRLKYCLIFFLNSHNPCMKIYITLLISEPTFPRVWTFDSGSHLNHLGMRKNTVWPHPIYS